MEPIAPLYALESIIDGYLYKSKKEGHHAISKELTRIRTSLRSAVRTKSDQNITFSSGNASDARAAFVKGFLLGRKTGIALDVKYFHPEGTTVCSLYWEDFSFERLEKSLVKIHASLDAATRLFVVSDVHES